MKNTFALYEKAHILYQKNGACTYGASVAAGEIILTQADREVSIDPESVNDLCALLQSLVTELKQ